MPNFMGLGTRKFNLTIVTWNVQGLKTAGKYEILLAHMVKHKIDILLMQETWITESTFS